MTLLLKEIEPHHPCDRCGHEMRRHAGPDRGTVCTVAPNSKVNPSRAKACLCDGYVPKP